MVGYIFTFVPQISDSLLDVMYFVKLNDDSNKFVHVPESVVITLAVFLGLAVFKDIICNIWTNALTKYEIIQSTPKPKEVDKIRQDMKLNVSDTKSVKKHLNSNVKLISIYRKSVILFYSQILEDGVQLFLQYFYFEKYLTEPDTFVLVNAVIKFVMILRFVYNIGWLLIKVPDVIFFKNSQDVTPKQLNFSFTPIKTYP